MSRNRIGALLSLLFTTALGAAGPARAQSGHWSAHASPAREVRAIPRTTPILLDGHLSEPAWAQAPAAGDFRQSLPSEGEPATQRTEVRFLFDDEALYVGARMFDDLGAAGVRSRLVRRDRQTDTDLLTIVFDTFHDHLGRTQFTVNPAGVRGDAYGPGNAGLDDTWDPVWQAATRTDSLGWTAELRIPFNQLRFPRDSMQTWGLQVVRFVSRLNERSHWAWWPNNEVGGPPRYGHLEGLVIASSPARLELLPYAVARSANVQPSDPTDPFARPHEVGARVGADLKYLLTSNLTLAATVNPDFGQVEVDPAVVNLSAFETFFPERRPVFIEGQGMFGFGGFSCFFCSNVSSLSAFFSRRIGRQPQGGGIARSAGAYADVPENTTILGAAKVTGRTAGGWTVGVVDAVTRRETARVQDTLGLRHDVEVEPFTNYFVGRLKHDLRAGNLVVGGIATSVQRDLSDSALSTMLSRHSESVGADLSWWWKNRTYRLMASGLVTQVAGDSAAILRLQRSSARYFQRPDRGNGSNGLFSDAYDSGATVVRGYGLYARLSKESGNWLWEASTNIRSPGFENNDIAFTTRDDYAWMSANLFRQALRPTRWYRQLFFIAGGQQQYNYDGDLTDRQVQGFAEVDLLNYWSMSAFYIRRPSVLDDRLTRGGPVVRRPGSSFVAYNLSSDSRKPLVLSAYPSYGRSDEGRKSWTAGMSLAWRPAPSVSLSLGPEYDYGEAARQYVTAVADPTATTFYGRRYVFADIVQRTLAMDTRLNVTFTTALSLEVYAQPFISSGRYFDFKEINAPRGMDYSVYGRDRGTITSTGSGASRVYTIDPDGAGPAASFTLGNPDFTFRSLRGNAVLRWEYRPGSTLYLVWTQMRSATGSEGDLSFGRDRRALLAAHPDNIFLVKASYWLGR